MRQRKLSTIFASIIAFAALNQPAFAQATFQEASKDYAEGRYSKALSEFKALEAAYPSNCMCHYYTALSHQALGHIDQARTEYQWVVDNGPAQWKAMASKGLSQLANAKTQIASSSVSTPAPQGGGQPAPAAKSKVKKVIEFYADW